MDAAGVLGRLRINQTLARSCKTGAACCAATRESCDNFVRLADRGHSGSFEAQEQAAPLRSEFMLSHDEATDSCYTVPREEEGDKQVSPTASLRASVLFFRAFNSTMARTNKLLDQILRGGADANIPFSGMAQLLKRLGFQERIKGSHHIFFRDGIAEILNLQPQSGKCKPYQVKQVRNVIINYRLAGDADA